MGSTLTEVIPLAIAAAVSPAILGALVLSLVSGQHRLAKGIGILVGSTIPLVLFAIAVLALWHGGVGGNGAVVGAWIDVVLGSLLIVAGLGIALLLLRNARDRRRASWHPVPHGGPSIDAPVVDAQGRPIVGPVLAKAAEGRRIDPDLGPWRSGQRALVTGLGLMLANVTTLAMYLPALKDIAQAQLPAGQAIAIVAIVIVIAQFPVIVIVVGYGAMHDRADQWLAPVGRWLAKHGRSVGMTVSIVAGIYLLLKGIAGL